MNLYKSIIATGAILVMGCLFPSSSIGQTASFSADTTEGCAPFTVTFTNTSTGASSYLWEFGDGATSTAFSPSHTYFVTGDSIPVWLYAYAGGNVDSTVLYLNIPQFTPYFNTPDSACPGQVVQFIALNEEPSDIVSWNMGDGFVTQGGFVQHTYADTGLYNVIMSVNTNSVCGTIVDGNVVTISDSVVPEVHVHNYSLVNDPTEICPGENFPFFYDENLSVHWDFGDGNTSTDPYPVHSYSSTGTYLATITVTNECGVSASIDTLISVIPSVQPIAAVFADHNTACPGEDVTFWGTPGFDMSYNWTFSDGMQVSGQYVTRSFPNPGWYSMTLVVSNLCGNSDTTNYSFFVDTTLIPTSILYITNPEICPGDDVTFIASQGLESYLWDFGDGNSDTVRTPTHSYAGPGDYPVTLEVTNLCGNSVIIMDTVHVLDSLPEVNIFINANQTIACPGTPVEFVLASVYDYQSIDWVIDGVTTITTQGDTLSHIFSSIGSHTITAYPLDYCGNTDSTGIIIEVDSSGYPVVDFTYTPYGPLCPGSPVYFENLSSDTLNPMWVFGTGDTSYLVNPQYTFPAPGNYLVQLTVENACGNTASYSQLVPISMSNLPAGSIINGDTAYICLGYDLFLNVNNQQGTPSWLWQGDTTSGSLYLLNEAMEISGYAYLEVTNNCGSVYDSIWVSVIDSLEASYPTCTHVGDSIFFSWVNLGAESFSISVDSGSTWITTGDTSVVVHESTVAATGFMVSHGLASCADSDTISFSCSLNGIEEGIEISSIFLYPNPASERITVDSPTRINSSIEFTIVDITGKQIIRDRSSAFPFSVDVSSINPGMYMMVLQMESTSVHHRFIIK